MCGIAGLIDPARTCGVDRLGADAAGMAATLAHRGPDDHGLWVDPQGRAPSSAVGVRVVILDPG